MLEVKSVVRRLMEFVNVDPTVFHPQEHRLTAEFNREKMYLWVDALYNFSFSLFSISSSLELRFVVCLWLSCFTFDAD
jgi:hypothetical protein